MLSLLVLLFPLLLMAFMLLMERVEDPLRTGADGDVEEFLETAAPDEVDTLVREGFSSAFARWRSRRRAQLTRLLPMANRTEREHAHSGPPQPRG